MMDDQRVSQYSFAVLLPGTKDSLKMMNGPMTLDDVMRVIGGWPVEMVSLAAGRATMYVHGNGKKEGFSLNETATAVARRSGGAADGPAIYGSVVIGGPVADARKPQPVSDEVLASVLPE